MILPINRAYHENCIFCGCYVSPRAKNSEHVVLKDGRKKIATRYFHTECYLENAKASKRRKLK